MGGGGGTLKPLDYENNFNVLTGNNKANETSVLDLIGSSKESTDKRISKYLLELQAGMLKPKDISQTNIPPTPKPTGGVSNSRNMEKDTLGA